GDQTGGCCEDGAVRCGPLPGLRRVQGSQPHLADLFGGHARYVSIRTGAAILDRDQIAAMTYRLRMRIAVFRAAVLVCGILFFIGSAMAQNASTEQKIWTLLDNAKAVFVSLSEADFRAGAAGFDLPDGGRSVSGLAAKAPGGVFDPHDVAKLPAQELGY